MVVVVVVVVWGIFHTRTWDGGGYHHHHHHHPRIVVSLWGRLHPPSNQDPRAVAFIKEVSKQPLLSMVAFIKQPL